MFEFSFFKGVVQAILTQLWVGKKWMQPKGFGSSVSPANLFEVQEGEIPFFPLLHSQVQRVLLDG
jgi:hypothetical protein